MKENTIFSRKIPLDYGSILIFLLALLVRIVYLSEIRSTVTFLVPIIDSSTYSEVARNVASGGVLDPRLFWQGFLYPVILAVFYKLFDSPLLAARIAQVVGGAITCVLVYRTGRLIFDRRTGLTAGLIMVFCGPMIFFEMELLAAGWAALLSMLLIMLYMKAIDKRQPWVYAAAGIVGGLASIARATFLPYVLVMTLFIVWKVIREKSGIKGKILNVVLITGTAAMILLTVSLLSEKATGHFSPIPRAGSLNLYVGNNHDTDATMMIRPGADWRRLVREPELNGFMDDSGHRRYFMNRFRDYVATDTGSFIVGLGSKTLQLISSREIPRNIDIYSSRSDSRILSLLVWKVGRFGFPLGIILPFAFLGLIAGIRKFSLPISLFLVVYAGALILVFISSRYRVVMLPVLSIMSAAGGIFFFDSVREREPKRLSAVLAVLLITVVLTTLPGPFVTEGYHYRAEKHASAGYELGKVGRLQEAAEQLGVAVELEPEYAGAHRMLGNVLSQSGKYESALIHFRKALEIEPSSSTTQLYVAVALAKLGRNSEALEYLDRAEEGALAAKEKMLYIQVINLRSAIERSGKEPIVQ
ncbi:MAG: glycosyltransferase family 39 protein [Bacteroidales bacterium]|nr:glycosyltransferase family 39 protein [Candidatus Latescibacterota bacterium]